jgi:hypothetical protein
LEGAGEEGCVEVDRGSGGCLCGADEISEHHDLICIGHG